MATEHCPASIASAALVIAWKLVAQARLTLNAWTSLGIPAPRTISRAMFGASTLGTTCPKTTSSTSARVELCAREELAHHEDRRGRARSCRGTRSAGSRERRPQAARRWRCARVLREASAACPLAFAPAPSQSPRGRCRDPSCSSRAIASLSPIRRPLFRQTGVLQMTQGVNRPLPQDSRSCAKPRTSAKGSRARCRISLEALASDSKKSAVEDDCIALIDAEVADKGGLDRAGDQGRLQDRPGHQAGLRASGRDRPPPRVRARARPAVPGGQVGRPAA